VSPRQRCLVWFILIRCYHSFHRSEYNETSDYLAAPQIAKSSGRSRSGSQSRDASPLGRRGSSPYTKPLPNAHHPTSSPRQSLSVDTGMVPPPNAVRTRRLSTNSSASDNPSVPSKPVKQKVTSTKTENAAKIRRTSDGLFICPIPGCNSTFTRSAAEKSTMRLPRNSRLTML